MGGQRHAPAVLPLGNIIGTHCTGGLVGSRAGLNWCEKSPPPPPAQWNSIPGPPSINFGRRKCTEKISGGKYLKVNVIGRQCVERIDVTQGQGPVTE